MLTLNIARKRMNFGTTHDHFSLLFIVEDKLLLNTKEIGKGQKIMRDALNSSSGRVFQEQIFLN